MHPSNVCALPTDTKKVSSSSQKNEWVTLGETADHHRICKVDFVRISSALSISIESLIRCVFEHTIRWNISSRISMRICYCMILFLYIGQEWHVAEYIIIIQLHDHRNLPNTTSSTLTSTKCIVTAMVSILKNNVWIGKEKWVGKLLGGWGPNNPSSRNSLGIMYISKCFYINMRAYDTNVYSKFSRTTIFTMRHDNLCQYTVFGQYYHS